MSGSRTIVGWWMLVALVAGSSLGCSASTPPLSSSVRHVSYRYSCCATGDVEPVRHTGEVFTLHWIATPSPATEPERPNETVTLTATMNGGFTDVAALKASPSAAPAIPAAELTTSTWAGGTPTSTIRIPTTATPGFYNVAWLISSGGASVGGATIIQVVGT